MMISEAEARARVGGVSRSTLWKWYADCRVPVTASKRPAVAWDANKLDARQRELARAQRRIARAAS
jgi:predicted DNA-binding transcriptional regulator AlpA